MTGPALALRGLSHRFGSLQALSSVNLTVNEGDIYGFLGLNGAGKTTSIRIVLGLVRHRCGDVQVLGSPTRRRPCLLFRQVGVLFEDFAAHPYLSGKQHLYLHGRRLGLARRDARRRAQTWLDRVGLRRHADGKVRRYSHGMKRRLGLACALVGSPKLVILDEPTNGLDPQGIADLRGLLLELNRETGSTFFLSSHILGEVERICSRVGIIHQGRMLLEQSMGEITGATERLRQLRVRPVAHARRLLAELPGCELVDSKSPWDPGASEGSPGEDSGDGLPGSVLVRVDRVRVPALVRRLVEGGIDVHEVVSAAETLETVFRRVVGSAQVAPTDPPTQQGSSVEGSTP